MDLGSLRTVVRDVSFDTLGVDATVTRPLPDDAPITTRVIWTTPTPEDAPLGNDFQRRESRRGLALRRDVVPTVPLKTVIVAAEPEGGTPKRWRVDGFERIDTATIRVLVVPDPEPPY